MISIVTGTLNRRELLPGLIENTVLSCDRIELVLVDGGSDDGTIEYLKSLNHERIKLIEIGKRSPYAHYMNIGIKESKYEWVAQWNDDVILLDSWDIVIEELKENYDFYIFKWSIRPPNDIYNDNFEDTWVRFDSCMNFGIYNKRVFKTIGMYDNKFAYYNCDQDMTQRALSFGLRCKYSDIHVCEIETEKRAVISPDDDKILLRNKKLYIKGKIPRRIEFLKD